MGPGHREAILKGRRPYRSGLARLGTCQPTLTVRAISITPKLWNLATNGGRVRCAAQVCAGNDTASRVEGDSVRERRSLEMSNGVVFAVCPTRRTGPRRFPGSPGLPQTIQGMVSEGSRDAA